MFCLLLPSFLLPRESQSMCNYTQNTTFLLKKIVVITSGCKYKGKFDRTFLTFVTMNISCILVPIPWPITLSLLCL